MIVNLSCPKCGSARIIKSGISWSGKNKRQRYACLECHSVTIKPDEKETEATPFDEIAPVSEGGTHASHK